MRIVQTGSGVKDLDALSPYVACEDVSDEVEAEKDVDVKISCRRKSDLMAWGWCKLENEQKIVA